MRQRDRRAARSGGVERSVGWAFSQLDAAGRRVAGVADREVAAQAGQRRLVEHLRDQAEILVDHHAGAVADTAMPAASWPRCCKAYSPK